MFIIVRSFEYKFIRIMANSGYEEGIKKDMRTCVLSGASDFYKFKWGN